MYLALPAAVVLALLAAAAFFFLFRRLLSKGRNAEADLEWSSEFSIARYRPMERLFLEEDYDFLAAQPGFHPKIAKKLQAERRRVFRRYLRCLRHDFERLATAAKVLLLEAPVDSPDLARGLLKQRMIFSYAMANVETRLVLQTLGIGKVDVRPLVDAVESMRLHLRQLSHAQVAAI